MTKRKKTQLIKAVCAKKEITSGNESGQEDEHGQVIRQQDNEELV